MESVSQSVSHLSEGSVTNLNISLPFNSYLSPLASLPSRFPWFLLLLWCLWRVLCAWRKNTFLCSRQDWWSKACPFYYLHSKRWTDFLLAHQISLLESFSTGHRTLTPLTSHPSTKSFVTIS